ncbi:hypothetical protein QAD02_008192 [Eretmocerus hayati]|uniref:Uncharacterized protein n=1 Tax=Eretmocerus hayati TaxID=131215 RepID=A0ACC2N5S8_9HYME|nr:hypothetical protein QAD02_008192 [Eretmocerus hayati]
MHHHPDDASLGKGLDGLVAIGASVQIFQTHCLKFGLDAVECARLVSTVRLDSTSLGLSCNAEQEVRCYPKSIYRSLDGSCNNLQNPVWGSAFTNYSRLLFPQYAAVWTGKAISCCKVDGQLPSPRYIHPHCNAITVSEDGPDYGKHGIRCLNSVRTLPVIKSDFSLELAEQLDDYYHKHLSN